MLDPVLAGEDTQRYQSVTFNSCPAQNFESPAGMCWIRIRCADNHAFDSCRDEGFRARRRASVRATRFERHVKRRALCRIGRVFARRGAPRFPRAASLRAGASRAR